MTLLASPPLPSKPPADPGAEHVLLHDISWDTYLALLADVGDGAARMTYDHGWLEIEMPGRLHELIKALVGEMVTTTLKRQRIAYEPAGATTWKRHELLRGLEADECYHIQTIDRVLGKEELNLKIDPSPDLAIEVEVTNPLLDKVAVYRGLRVPELWRVRFDGRCDMFRLDTDGAYQPIAASVAVPPFTRAVVSRFLLLRAQLNHSGAIARFEAEFLPTVIPVVSSHG